MSNGNMIYVPNEVLTVVVDNQPYTIAAAHPNFKACVEAAKAGDFDAIPSLADIPQAIRQFSEGKIEVDEGAGIVLYGGEPMHNYAADRLLGMMYEGFNIDPLVKFLENLLQNPSKRAVDELYKFLEHGKMPLTPDGHFLAYKRVRSDYKSVHDGKTDNSIGKVVEMPRNKVDDNSQRTCSYGLHFCSHEYLKNFSGDKVVVLKVNPRDVVSIPADYNDTKGRACRYEVVGELSPDEVERALDNNVWDGRSVVGDYDPDYDDADRDFDDQPFGDEDFEASDDNYNEGYTNGYDDGRDKEEPAVTEDDEPTTQWEEGYVAGYRDGRGHKSRAVPKS
ncbi:MAG: hypothetical protein QXL17_02915 [Candidatus Thermoplasmatota archaeon]